MTYEVGDTINVPISWLKGSRWYASHSRETERPLTGQEMRDLGYVINEFTWPSIRWEKGDR